MDIWSWVYDEIDRVMEEDRRLGWMIHKLPSWVTDNEYEQVDSAVPELIAGVRRLKRPWLEVFVRHWHMQSLVLDRHDVSGSLGQAIELLERAHQDDAKDCPQTVCVSQDVCSAYGIADGPGFAEERLAVSEETLDRIDPSWPCWSCINREHISALIDQGRFEEALERGERTRAQMREAGQEFSEGEFALQDVDALIGLGRLQEAYDAVSVAERPGGGKRFERHKQAQIARCLAALDRHEEALAQLPAWEDVEPYTFIYDDYARAVSTLIRANALRYDSDMHRRFVHVVRRLQALGAARDAVDLGLRAATLCGGTGSPTLGLAMLRLIEPTLAKLRKPLGAPEQVAQLRARLEADAQVELPEREEELDVRFADGLSIEEGLAITERFPERLDHVLSAASWWRQMHHPEEARALLEGADPQHAGDAALFFALGEALRELGELDALEAHVAAYADSEDPALRVHRAWLASHLAEARGDKDAALRALAEVVEGSDEVGPALLLRLARGAHEAGELEDALKAYERLVAALEPPSDAHWELLVVATRLARWGRVREVARALGMQIDSDSGPIREDWGLIKVHFQAEGPDAVRWARRTGPVTATVLSITGPKGVEHYEDELVFEPTPMNPEDEEGPKVYPAVVVTRSGEYSSFALDGVHPGEDVLSGLKGLVNGVKGELRVVSGERYTLTDPDTGEERLGVYAYIAWPTRNPVALLQMLVSQAAQGVEHPLVWRELAEAAGEHALAAQHAEIAKQWGM